MDPALLHLAAASGDETIFEIFSKSDALLKETLEKNSVLHVATLHKQGHIVEKILQSHGSLLYHKNSGGDTALHVAARIGCREIAKLLIDHGRLGETAAVVSGQKKDHPKVMKMVNLKKDSVLHDAVRNGHLSVVKLLIEEDCELALCYE
ncbi:hypothetical protein L484_016295 [Morus notabilis]|uniref:Uncharacterized protein n=1 Tax=Morus notabilis TaxID=981085 RepID=W9RGY1_9ROSA|nr:hypothetical protein L484_016295 [Morus notabilis]